jgi:anti-sigma factor RsiW
MNFQDVELLSAYLDGRLSPPDSARVERRLVSEPNLKTQLDELRETRAVLRRLPQRRAPRNFRLTPKMAGLRAPEPRAYPIFRVATALATFLFLVSVAVNGLAPVATSHLAAAPAPSYGMGGGGGGGPAESSTPAATEVLPQAFSAALPTATVESTVTAGELTNAAPLTQDSSRNLAAPTPEQNKAAPLQPGRARSTPQLPVPLPWVIALGLLTIVFAVTAWLLRQNNDRRARERWNRK